MTDIVKRLRGAHTGSTRLQCEAADEIDRLTAERDERSAEIARLLMKIDRLRKEKSAWQDVAVGYGDAIGKLRHILPPD